LENRELNQARSEPDTFDRPVRTAHTFVHHCNIRILLTYLLTTQQCNTDSFLYIPLPPDQRHISAAGVLPPDHITSRLREYYVKLVTAVMSFLFSLHVYVYMYLSFVAVLQFCNSIIIILYYARWQHLA